MPKIVSRKTAVQRVLHFSATRVQNGYSNVGDALIEKTIRILRIA